MSQQLSSSQVGTLTRLIFTILLIGVAMEDTAHAYIDPGTGSLILQALVAGAVSVVFFFRQGIVRLTPFLRLKSWRSDRRPKK